MPPQVVQVPSTEPEATSRVVLRDGSTAGIRTSHRGDSAAMRAFFDHLSKQSLRRRFMGSVRVADSMIEQLCDNGDPHARMTLVVCRRVDQGLRFIGVASYFATNPSTAEIAFAVDDGFQGKGVGTTLLERLVPLAIEKGFDTFEASMLAENQEMLQVFRDSGFEIRSNAEGGCISLRLTLTDSPDSATATDRRDRIATVASLRPLFEPRAIAVIGASRDRANLGRRVFDALVASNHITNGSAAPSIFPVNPVATSINGVGCYRSARELPAGIDLAVIAVPAPAVTGVIEDCAAAGIKSVVVISSGFGEAGGDGPVRQRRLVELVRSYGMRLVGPNCMGVLSLRAGSYFNASFARRLPSGGHIAMASQSGGLGLALLELAAQRRVGLSTFISLGNKADVSGNDFLQYSEADPATSVILLYLESIGNPDRFARLARRVSRKKPIVVVKAGRTPAGNRAAASHTAGLAASELAVDALFRQSGVIRADTIDEMFDIGMCLEAQPLPAGRRVAILTNAGGPGILAADACIANGLVVNELSAMTMENLRGVVPNCASFANPIDLGAAAEPREFEQSVPVVLGADDVDSLLVIYTTIAPETSPAVLAAIECGIGKVREISGRKKPVLVCTMASAPVQPLHAGEETIPVYAFPEPAAKALAKVSDYALRRMEPPGATADYVPVDLHGMRAFCQSIIEQRGDVWLSLPECRTLLSHFGLNAAPGPIVQSADEAASAARAIGFPVAVKIVSQRLLHKSDAGGVKLNLGSEEAVRRAFDEMHTSQPEGVLIQPMRSGVETFVGMTRDPIFGPLVAFGLGGITVEVFRDVVFRIAPLTDVDANEMLHGIRGLPLLQGYRGRPPADVDAIRDLLLRVSFLAAHVPEVQEMDLNPVMAFSPGCGCEIVDVRVRVGKT